MGHPPERTWTQDGTSRQTAEDPCRPVQPISAARAEEVAVWWTRPRPKKPPNAIDVEQASVIRRRSGERTAHVNAAPLPLAGRVAPTVRSTSKPSTVALSLQQLQRDLPCCLLELSRALHHGHGREGPAFYRAVHRLHGSGHLLQGGSVLLERSSRRGAQRTSSSSPTVQQRPGDVAIFADDWAQSDDGPLVERTAPRVYFSICDGETWTSEQARQIAAARNGADELDRITAAWG
jgi:hypothetical protein